MVCHQMASSCNRLVGNHGFSPNQWVLGTGHRLPASLAETDADPAVVSRVQEGSHFWQRLKLEQTCSEAFFRASNSSGLRRAALARTRPQPGPFERGELLMYWRSHNLKRNLHGHWHGPARCFGRDEHGYWLVHRRIPMLCSPDFLRRAAQQELQNYKINELHGDQMQIEMRGRRAGRLGFMDLRHENFNPGRGHGEDQEDALQDRRPPSASVQSGRKREVDAPQEGDARRPRQGHPAPANLREELERADPRWGDLLGAAAMGSRHRVVLHRQDETESRHAAAPGGRCPSASTRVRSEHAGKPGKPHGAGLEVESPARCPSFGQSPERDRGAHVRTTRVSRRSSGRCRERLRRRQRRMRR